MMRIITLFCSLTTAVIVTNDSSFMEGLQEPSTESGAEGEDVAVQCAGCTLSQQNGQGEHCHECLELFANLRAPRDECAVCFEAWKERDEFDDKEDEHGTSLRNILFTKVKNEVQLLDHHNLMNMN